MREKVAKYIKLMEKWSKLILEGKEKEGFALMEKDGNEMEDSFSREDWEELIASVPNKQAQIAWTEKMNKKFSKQ